MAKASRYGKRKKDYTTQEPVPEELSFEDRIARFAQHYLQPYWHQILLAVLVGILAVTGIGIWLGARKAQHATLFQKLAAAQSADELANVAEKAKGNPAGKVALLKLGRHYFRQGEYRKAAETFDRFTNAFPNASMTVEAKLGRAYALESAGNLKEAQELFKSLAESEKGLSDSRRAEAYLGAGRCAENREAYSAAIDLYQAATELKTGNSFRREAGEALKMLRAYHSGGKAQDDGDRNEKKGKS